LIHIRSAHAVHPPINCVERTVPQMWHFSTAC
jgi:hypothetical protein